MPTGIGISIPGMTAAVGAFVPSDLSGLVNWYRADQGITLATGVSQWNDIGGGGNHVTQVTGASQPTYSPSDADFAGQPSLDFDGTNDSLFRAALATTTTGDMEWAIVLRSDTADATERWVVENNGTGGRNALVWTRSTGATHHLFTTSFASSVPDSGVTQDLIFSFDATGPTCRLFEKGVDRGTVVWAGGDFDAGFGIGSVYTGAGNHFDGRIAELIIYNRRLTVDERAKVRAYFGRYGIT